MALSRSSSSDSTADNHISHQTTRHTPTNDLEKQSTASQSIPGSGTHSSGIQTPRRVSRTQSLAKRSTVNRNRFTHPLAHAKTTEAEIVDFEGPDDPYRPLNWPFRKKCVTTLLYGLTTMGSTWASSVYSPAVPQIAEQFHVTTKVAVLGLAFMLFGFALGPLIWAPLSEVYGRKPAMLAPYFISICFSFATATSENIQTVLLTRFFGGLFGSAPVTNTGGVLGDIWSPSQRGIAVVGYAMAVVGGPLLGPIAGGAITSSYLKWRWTEYITGIMQSFFLVLDLLVLDESYPSTLLVTKARRLRHESGNWALHARHEEWDVSLKELANTYMKTPFRLLGTPICFLMALYASFVYGILYLCFLAVPIVFAEERGWGPVTSEVPFIAVLLGTMVGGALNIYNNKFYVKQLKINNGRPVPEARLPPMMIGSFFFASGLFIFGWTSSRKIFWLAPCIGLGLMGTGFFTIFQAAVNYLIDTFANYAASAVAANTFLRSVVAGVFPLFATEMFHGLGIEWASSLLGFMAVAMIPIPFLFHLYGARIRQRGTYSASIEQ